VKAGVGAVKKLADRALATATKTSTPSSAAFYRLAESVANEWREHASEDVRLLADPALLAIGRALEQSPFSRGYFDTRIAALAAAYKPLTGLGEIDNMRRPIELALVTSARHLALVRRRTIASDLDLLGTATVVHVARRISHRKDRYDFDQWVDRSMYRVALAHTPEPLVIDDTDPRWDTVPAGRWLHSDDGVTMLGLTSHESGGAR